MTNFEVLIKNNPVYVKEVLASSVEAVTLKRIVEGSREHYGCYTASVDKREMDFLNKEYHRVVLDDVEKEYLGNIIKPFRNKVRYIKKYNFNGDDFFITIRIYSGKSTEDIDLPTFNRCTHMYDGMVLEKEYTLEELGL